MVDPIDIETTSLLNGGDTKKKKHSNQWLASLLCGVLGIALGMALMMPSHHDKHHIRTAPHSFSTSTQSPYTKVQGLGFQIYTGGAPYYLGNNNNNTTINPECTEHSLGSNMGEGAHEQLQCYIGHENAIHDVSRRINIMEQAVDRAYDLSDPNASTLKIFIAPEFYWRGLHGAYMFDDDKNDDDCGPICLLLKGMEDIVAQPRFENWLFLFGTVVASEVLPKRDFFDFLFYNFAPVYKGYDPASTTTFEGKRFLVPKRYVSSSDFLTPKRHYNMNHTKELLDKEFLQHDDDKTVLNPFDFDQKRYDNDLWIHYKKELNTLGYTMIEYDWLMLDGLSLTIEICFDHDRRTALNSYLADIVTGSTTLIPSSFTNKGRLEYVPIPKYQAQISLVSSAGMTVTEDSLALTHNGTIFLQDGLSNETGKWILSQDECNAGGLQVDGGTEAVQRKAVLTPTDVFFELKVVDAFTRHAVFGKNWKEAMKGSFSAEVYEPMITVYDPIDIAKVTP